MLNIFRKDLPTSLGRSRLTTTDTTTWLKYASISCYNRKCVTCRRKLTYQRRVDNVPEFLLLSWSDVGIKMQWKHNTVYNNHEYFLCGLIYLGNFHFTCRIIQKNGNVWYHDGIKTKKRCAYEGHIDNMSQRKLNSALKRPCIMGIYCRSD